VSDLGTATILCVGSELTEGIVQDTHVRFLSSELTALGFSVSRGEQIPDDEAVFREEIIRAASGSQIVIVTGGLGPTSDDLTREVVAEAAGMPLEFHPEVWEALQARFAGARIPEANRKQAMAPRGFTLIANEHGTAPGFYGKVKRALVIALPGPPGELRPMFSERVVPLIAQRFAAEKGSEALRATALLVPESSLEEALGACRRPGVSWGTRVDEDRIAFSLRGGSAAERDAVLDGLIALLGETRVRRSEVKPAQLLTDVLLERGLMLVTAESCTGGLLGKWLTDLPGSSRVYWGGFVTYSNQAKSGLLGVGAALLEEHGAVSEQAVKAMARGALEESGADVSIAVSGIAGPDGGTSQKPVGTIWVAVDMRGKGAAVHQFLFAGSRDAIRRRTAVASFLFAESWILGRDFSIG
jgi:nicotinamide-nucleotide amidase